MKLATKFRIWHLAVLSMIPSYIGLFFGGRIFDLGAIATLSCFGVMITMNYELLQRGAN